MVDCVLRMVGPVSRRQSHGVQNCVQCLTTHFSYYVGDNGLTLFNFGPTAFQNLMYQAAGDPGTLQFLGRERNINSIVLLANGKISHEHH